MSNNIQNNPEYLEFSQRFIDSVKLLTASLQSERQTPQQQDEFLQLAEQAKNYGYKLPDAAACQQLGLPYDQLCESFLAILISMISLKQSSNYVFQAIQSLLNFLRHDPYVFQKFRPSKPLI
jgi:hypothetical protein